MELFNKGYIILGNIDIINDITKKYDEQMFIVLESNLNRIQGFNTIYLDKKKLKTKVNYFIVNGRNEIIKTGLISYMDIFSDLKVSAKFFSEAQKNLDNKYIKSLNGFVPLFYLNLYKDNKNSNIIEYYSQLRYSEIDIIFIKTGEYNSSAKSIWDKSFNSLLNKLIETHRKNALFLGNHQCYYRKEESSKEIEYKFNILSDINIWNTTVEMYNHFKANKFKDFILEYKDEIQKWDYMNYMFEVVEPMEERGYISFIPQTNGKELIKRKIFSEDQLSRTEIHIKDNIVNSSRSDFLSNKFNVKTFEFQPFRRVRYDINIESLKSGNVHGIFFDYITVIGSNKKLIQCEIEYLRTRSLFSNNNYIEELKLLKDYVITYFKDSNIEYLETFYSKLSFMKDVNNRR